MNNNIFIILNENNLKYKMKPSYFSKQSKLHRFSVIITVLIFFGIKKYISIKNTNFYDNDNMLCVTDHSYEFTNILHNTLRTHRILRIVCQTLISIVLDINIMTLSYLWILSAKNWRMILTLILFFSFREFITHIYQIILDEDLIWGYAGIPSLSTSYHKNKTFFFSGTLGLYFICATELRSFKFTKMSNMTYLFTIFHALLLVSLRAQYFIGIFCSIISAHYFHLLSEKYCHFLNDLYDFDTETTNKKNQIQFEKNLKVIVENTIKRNSEDIKIGYQTLGSSAEQL